MLRNILLDLDNTIMDFGRAERSALSNTLKSFGTEPREEYLVRYSQINDLHWKQLELGRITREEVLLHRFVQFLEEFDLDLDARAVRSSYESNLAKGYFLLPGAGELLKDLSRDFCLYIVSNGTPSVQYGRIEGSGTGRYFKDIFISKELGYEKPDRRFFEEACGRIPGYKAGETVLVGDSLTSDILGANNAGIRSIWYNPGHSANHTAAVPDFTVGSFEELREVIRRLHTE